MAVVFYPAVEKTGHPPSPFIVKTPSDQPGAPTPGLRVLLPDETEITVAPVTIRQAQRALALHPQNAATETMLDYILRLRSELDLLLGSAHDGLASTLPPVTARDLAATLWTAASGYEPMELAPTPVRQNPPGRTKPAREILALVNRTAAVLRTEFLPLSQRVEDMPLADALRLVTPGHFELSARR